MVDPNPFQADPSAIGGIAKAPYGLPPAPERLFARRADRFHALAPGHRLAPYLHFLEALSRIQADLAVRLPAPTPIAAERLAQARAAAMPPIDRRALAVAAELPPLLDAFFDTARAVAMPPAARDALDVVCGSDAATRTEMAGNVLSDAIPSDALAPHLFVAAAVQVLAARLAATLEPASLVPVGIGVCPACGGPPLASVVVGFMGAEGARYALCSCCATSWNEVRVKCLACGSTKGVGYREAAEAGEDATIKAEVCDECRSWLKILYQNRNPSLDGLADDVGSLGLDMLMRGTGYRCAGFNPYMLGY